MTRAVAEEPDEAVDELRQELEAARSELRETRAELLRTRDDLSRVEDRVGAVEGSRASLAEPSSTARLAPVNANNPAISFVVSARALENTEQGDSGFELQTGELFINAPIDPFLRGYTSINGNSDESFDVEEAALITTALPLGLMVKGGRFFTHFGRLPHLHDEQLPFVKRPRSIDELVGGESAGEGAHVSWLLPTDQYVELLAGAFNSIGAERQGGFFSGSRRNFENLTYFGRAQSFFDLSDDLNLEVGGSVGIAPSGPRRRLFGTDVTLRHQPGTSSLYQGTVFGTEWVWNRERFDDQLLGGNDPVTGEPLLGRQIFSRWGGYAYLESFFARRFSAGVLYDRSESASGLRALRNTYSAFATWKPSEFQRLRLQVDVEVRSGAENQRISLQWTAFLGSHSHGFVAR